MLDYYSTQLLQHILVSYLPRIHLAEERGYSNPSDKYHWLYEELHCRVVFLRGVLPFLDALPRFMVVGTEALQYVTSYVGKLFAVDWVSSLRNEKTEQHPYFQDNNPYWTEFQEVLDHIDDGYDLGDLPQLYVDLSEYVVRASRLYLQIRECSIHAIDRDKFEALLSRKPEFSQAG